MNESIKDLLKRLEGITMDLHRSAANLDKIVQDMKITLENERSAEFCEHYIGVMADNRATYHEYACWDLKSKELKIWELLLEEAHKLKDEEL